MTGTVQRRLDVDEEYPVYHLRQPDTLTKYGFDDTIPVPADLAARYDAAVTEWLKVQDLIYALDERLRRKDTR